MPVAADLSPAAAGDLAYMRQALALAAEAAAAGEVPVGALVVRGGGSDGDVIVARAHNLCERLPDPTAHAERLAIAAAAAALGRWRLNDCSLFVTLEPCMMCAGAIVLARLRRVVFAARLRPDTGSPPRPAGEGGGWLGQGRLAPGLALTGGVMAADSEALLTAFFAARRPGSGAPSLR